MSTERDKKRSSLNDYPPNGGIGLATMASSYLSGGPSNATSRNNRPSTPPASTYFTTFAADPQQKPVPTPDAQTHFAFSSTLVRRPDHSPTLARQELGPAEGFFDKVLRRNKAPGYQELESGDGSTMPNGNVVTHHGQETTSSSRFAHLTVEV